MSRERKESELEGESGGGVGSGSVPIGGARCEWWQVCGACEGQQYCNFIGFGWE